MNTQPGRFVQAGRFLTLLVANVIKVGGLYVAIKTVNGPAPNALIVGFSAFMMAGAQVSEDKILRFIGHIFGVNPPEEPPK